MAHFVEFIPGPTFSTDPSGWDWDGEWRWVCDCDTTQPCRWTADCDCESWDRLTVDADGSSAVHFHGDAPVPMRVDTCLLQTWFEEDDKEWALPPRPGKSEVTVEWDWEYPLFSYAEDGAE